MRYFYPALAFLLFFGCKSDRVVLLDGKTGATNYIEKYKIDFLSPIQAYRRQGFRYKVPEGMTESPADAYRYKYDNLLLDRGADYFSSTIVIAIRHYDLNSYEKLNDFSIMDQSNLKKSVTPYYENEWKPTALEDKNIEHESFQFYYTMQKMKVYQRSVYIKSENTVHIISLSTLYKDFLNRPESEGFWNSIRID
ncbi:MAG: hypothetical protein A2015_12490 [Spirochaetes bacterium GWF1_31_7]|nr:MAG: hypothetical protein A2Y30_12520 [Spirochaetes bacterium GWE1_32_154]OHD49599.1 MAG: hypothetical protein A2015_12490 [Spirochaetes bacterium GWF1_31_7]OHD72633.1 MAG: hypothetical protein A2355_11895 [Spirochaetes bacterium RIFOXYB1_FULL_32_8]HBD93763.1 hypothetical protein [Spirochaetia bacterium]